VTDAGDRELWRLVARRDFWVRLRERSFLISTLLNLAVISVLIVIRAFGGAGSASFDVGVVGDDPIGRVLPASGAAVAAGIDVVRYEEARAALEALRSGSVDAVIDGDRIVGRTSVPTSLGQAAQAAEITLRLQRVFDEYGVAAEDQADVATGRPLDVQVLEPGDPNRDQNAAIAFIGVLLLYGQVFGYGVWVASGVIEEKSSRVVEILLSTMRARQLMTGKIVGIGLLGLAQLAVIGSFAVVLGLLTDAIDLPGSAVGAALLVLVFFVIGFAFYASLFAAAGALVSRMEELQNILVPINLVILVSFIVSIGALQDPDGSVVRVASILPTSSALAMPVRIVLGAASGWEIVASVGASLVATALLVPAAGRLYSGAVLRSGARVKLREAWRAAP
jgi:ABC-2 type transport system permease protein